MTSMTDPAVRRLVDRALLPLRAVDESLHVRAVDYVVDGASSEVLLDISSHGDDPRSLLVPAVMGASHFLWGNGSRRGRLEAVGIRWRPADHTVGPVLALRDALYRSDRVLPRQWARLGRLLDAVLRAGTDREPPSGRAPGWLEALLGDVVWTIDREDVGTTLRAHAERLGQDRSGWDARRLVTLLTEEGHQGDEQEDARDDGEDRIPAALFLATYSYSTFRRLSPADLPGVTDYLTGHADALPASVMSELDLDGRRHVLEHMAVDAPWACAGAHLIAALAAGASKEVRREAIELLGELDPPVRNAALVPVLAVAPASRATELVEFLSVSEGGADLLAEAAEANRRLAEVICRTRARHDALSAEGADEPIILPPFTPLETGPSAAAVKVELRAALDRLAGRTDAQQNSWIRAAVDRARTTTDADLDALVAAADGETRERPALLGRFDVRWIAEHAPSLTLAHALRLHAVEAVGSPGYWWYGMTLSRYAGRGADPRAVEELMTRLGCDSDALVAGFHGHVFHSVEPETSWPWYAEHPELLREALADTCSATRALEILRGFPRVPVELLPAVADVAVGSSKVNRPLAQAVLRRHPRVRDLAEQGLTDRRAEIRASAAAWVGSLGESASAPALAEALRGEKRDVVRAGLLAALRDCGGDTDEFLSPGALGVEAAEGLRRRAPASLAWFDLDALPAVRWRGVGARSASPVDSTVIRWWVVLADRLKDPSGRGIIDLYLSLLEPADAAVLASYVVRAWVVRDTRHPAQEESRAHARTAGERAHDRAQRWLATCRADAHSARFLSRAEAEAAIPLEERVARAYAEHQRTYLGSAMTDKGLLAFAVRMDGAELAELVRSYMRANPGRRAQFDALVRCLHANSSPEALQVLLSIARRHTMAGVRSTAAALARDAAEERGWSAEELADRTIPAAGFDDDGLLRLSYGRREFVGRLTPEFTIALTDADGRSRRSLPAARSGEDEDAVKAARKRLTASRKEARTILALQSERLYEAMCVGRTWTAAEWRELLAAHPLVGRLVTRLIWTAAPPAEDEDDALIGPGGVEGISSTGGGVLTFRPTEDGALVGADDAVIELDERGRVGVAHGTLLDPGLAAAWREHLADYEVEPLFDQLSATAPRVEEGQEVVSDHEGHVTDTLAFRGTAAARGYRRGEVLDGGAFDTYAKVFSSAGLTAVLGFTGSWVPEENIPCATTGLSFKRGDRVPLSEVPPVLLAECYADYRALAALGPYDSDWEKNASPR